MSITRPISLRCLHVAALLMLSSVTAQAETTGFLDPLGPIAELQRLELVWAAIIILIAVLPVFVGVPYIFFYYRRSNEKAGYAPDWDMDHRLEATMWAIPTLIIIALSIWLTQATYRIDPYRDIDAEVAQDLDADLTGPPVTVDVVGLDWKWLYLYPEAGFASVGELRLPVGRPVTMRLTSDTVMQSYFASGLAGQIYTMPGMITELNFLADREGETLAENTQYNGPGFSRQRSPVRAVPDADYTLWLAQARGAPPLDDAAYALLAKSGDLAQARADFGIEGDGPLLFSLPEGDLFGRIVARYMSGEPVALSNQPGSPEYDPAKAELPATPHSREAHLAMQTGRGIALTADGYIDGGICEADDAQPIELANSGLPQ